MMMVIMMMVVMTKMMMLVLMMTKMMMMVVLQGCRSASQGKGWKGGHDTSRRGLDPFQNWVESQSPLLQLGDKSTQK